jgi:hypothetical protein
MSPIADMVMTLIEAGTPPSIAAVVVAEAFAAGAKSGGIPVDKTAEHRREYDRQRKREKRTSGGIPVESADSADAALILTSSIDNKEKKVRARKHPLPPDWRPSEDLFAYGADLGYSRDGVLSKFEDMRLWAISSGTGKADWTATLQNFLRKDSPKPSQALKSQTVVTITPASKSWNAWKSHFRDAGKNNTASIMDKCASDGKPFTVQSEWPPGMGPNG